ncbi:hypothetical protein CLV58_109139 [Spirosoma oryzae]|uniref:Uncharacterized protein n=1 Tax=Spirosoma oryzae TaxID=1469603 RepID=A0A2T0SYB5_9BACT|nr:hypothetical protein [Spirosoma oryzae]PRY38412.1 hypothetical protein CLV58_109139 [Spirosoma oryzae]
MIYQGISARQTYLRFNSASDLMNMLDYLNRESISYHRAPSRTQTVILVLGGMYPEEVLNQAISSHN